MSLPCGKRQKNCPETDSGGTGDPDAVKAVPWKRFCWTASGKRSGLRGNALPARMPACMLPPRSMRGEMMLPGQRIPTEKPQRMQPASPRNEAEGKGSRQITAPSEDSWPGHLPGQIHFQPELSEDRPADTHSSGEQAGTDQVTVRLGKAQLRFRIGGDHCAM